MTDRNRLFIEMDTASVSDFGASVYEPAEFKTPGGDAPYYYGIMVPTECVLPLMTHVPAKETYFVRSRHRPRVYSGGIAMDDLTTALQRLDALNASRDLVFAEKKLRVELLQYEFVAGGIVADRLGLQKGQAATTVSLVSVQFIGAGELTLAPSVLYNPLRP